MIASDLISTSISPLKPADPIQKALDKMADFKVSHLPIVNETQFLGLLAEEDLANELDFTEPVGAITLSLINPYVIESQHAYDVIKTLNDQSLSLLPVLDAKMNYLGAIFIDDAVEYLANITAVASPGGIIVLEISNRDNSLAHIAQIVESDNAQILSSYVDEHPDSTKLTVTIKVNKMDITQIVASFLRYDYVVMATFNNSNPYNKDTDRYDSLMNYLSF
ncbi:CBS domain-containing protein [Pelobium manganitolerans]|uniref:CBS domain-containing protein n=1 Tax=Pelobium manganitolerans TaxID=1842495 RepID=A0A419S3G9_9SPHI|nr:CBS domain-containing protein [Pelobium manganitolerans]RKD13720.1 CBS domain-containing protein [Pelobium manganitolerans]